MSTYVDPLLEWGWKMRGRTVPSCHMIADTLEELHAMAAAIGMKRTWFQANASHPHYDLTPARRADAVRRGAIELDRRAFVETVRRHKKAMAAAAPVASSDDV